MTAIEIECIAGCPDHVTAEPGDPVRCPACGTKYDGTTVVSSPVLDIEAGAEARRVDVASGSDEPDGGGATVSAGAIDLNLNISVDDG